MNAPRDQDTFRLRLESAMTEGRITRGVYMRAMRARMLRTRRREVMRMALERHKARLRRADRNLVRWEQRTQLQGTTAWIDTHGRFHYWGFDRNETKMWGRRRKP